MFIPAQKYFMTGNGNLGYKDIKINTDDISTVEECGYESRPYTGLKCVTMKTGEKIYASLNMEDIK